MQQRRKPTNKKVPPDEIENARWGYQAAISSVISHDEWVKAAEAGLK